MIAKPSKPRSVSKKRRKQLRVYEKVTKPYLRERDDNKCIGCGADSYCIHHGDGREGNLLNDVTRAGCICFECHKPENTTREFNQRFIERARDCEVKRWTIQL
jgi:hypothetical protein